MVLDMRGNGSMTNKAVTVWRHGLKAESMKVNMLMLKRMAKASILGLMDQLIRASGLTISQAASESTFGQTVGNTSDSGKSAISKDRVS